MNQPCELCERFDYTPNAETIEAMRDAETGNTTLISDFDAYIRSFDSDLIEEGNSENDANQD